MSDTFLTPDVLNAFVHVSRLHGVDTTLQALQRRYAFDEEGVPATALVSIATDLRLEASWTQVKWSQLPKLRNVLPAMLMLRDGTASVLQSVTDEQGSGLVTHVIDPQATGDVQAAIGGDQLSRIRDGRCC